MAKQSGLHQIRGKVGEHSYYKQTGVNAGLIRSINQGMSARVKNDEAFSNTRLNNAEFGQAGAIAGVLGKLVVPKYRPMILPFSQSKMAKSILEAIKTASGNWGQRNLTSTDVQVVLQALNSVHKNDPSEFGLKYSIDSDDQFVIEASTDLFGAKLNAIGADGVQISLIAARPWIGTYSQTDRKYAQSYARANIYSATLNEPGSDATFDYEFRPAPPTGWPAFYLDFFVVVIMPFRTINNEIHILQEFCSFEAIDMPGQE